MITVKSLRLGHQRVLLRVDFNVPLRNGKVADDFRIRAALPTIKHCLSEGASVVLMSHLGRPGGKKVEELSLISVGEILSDVIEKPVKFSYDCVSGDAVAVSRSLMPGDVHLLENLRFHKGETANDPVFSRELSAHGTVYVNDAFGTAHRPHASNVGVVGYFQQKAIGLLMENEYTYLHKVLMEPERPMVIILGGVKLGTKLGLIRRFLKEADAIVVGGAMAFTFLKAGGLSVGRSFVEDGLMETAKTILDRVRKSGAQLYLPVDLVTADDIESGKSTGTKHVEKIGEREVGVDIGMRSVELFRQVIEKGKTIVWNGPMGIFEKKAFSRGTRGVAEAVARATTKGSISILGGGDTAAAVRMLEMQASMSHISTGGGASLQLLAGNDLPAFDAMEDG